MFLPNLTHAVPQVKHTSEDSREDLLMFCSNDKIIT